MSSSAVKHERRRKREPATKGLIHEIWRGQSEGALAQRGIDQNGRLNTRLGTNSPRSTWPEAITTPPQTA